MNNGEIRAFIETYKNVKEDSKYEFSGSQILQIVKALEQQPSEDCVSRQAVTDAVENTIAEYIPTFIGLYEKIPLELARAIKDVPPVTPTRNKPKEDITEDEVRINMLELALNQAKEHAESIEVLTENHRLIFRAEKRGSENG